MTSSLHHRYTCRQLISGVGNKHVNLSSGEPESSGEGGGHCDADTLRANKY